MYPSLEMVKHMQYSLYLIFFILFSSRRLTEKGKEIDSMIVRSVTDEGNMTLQERSMVHMST